MQSIAVKTCTQFDISESLAIAKGDDTVGNIEPTGRTLIIENSSFQEFRCSYNITVHDDILVRELRTGDLVSIDEYQKSKAFMLYYCNNLQVIFAETPTLVAKGFFASLVNTYKQKVTIDNVNFNFQSISQHLNQAKSIYFNVEDDKIDTKMFFGTGVDEDYEAVEAIDSSKATYIMAEIDVRGRARTIGFSQKGSIVIYSKPNDLEVENPYIEIAYAAYNQFGN